MGPRGRTRRGGTHVRGNLLPVRAPRARDGMESMTDRIAVVGAGQMGNGIAHVFAQHEFQVTMIDVSQAALDKGRATIAKNVERQVKKGTIPAQDQVKILSRIDLKMELDAASDASLVIEAASE